MSLGFAMSGNGQPRAIWVDQDGGWEDVAAIAILLRSPDVKVMGIATTPGIASPSTANNRVTQLLEDLKERDAKLVSKFPPGAEILATGPLSRVARLIQSKHLPKSITWMGGAIKAKGNAKFGAEWNAASDPKSLSIVLSSSVPFTICPLDLTNQFPSEPTLLKPGGAPVCEQIRKAYMERDRFWWDELAAASIAAPALFTRAQVRLRPDARGRLTVSPHGRVVDVLTGCDRAAFKNLLERSLRF